MPDIVVFFSELPTLSSSAINYADFYYIPVMVPKRTKVNMFSQFALLNLKSTASI